MERRDHSRPEGAQHIKRSETFWIRHKKKIKLWFLQIIYFINCLILVGISSNKVISECTLQTPQQRYACSHIPRRSPGRLRNWFLLCERELRVVCSGTAHKEEFTTFFYIWRWGILLVIGYPECLLSWIDSACLETRLLLKNLISNSEDFYRKSHDGLHSRFASFHATFCDLCSCWKFSEPFQRNHNYIE